MFLLQNILRKRRLKLTQIVDVSALLEGRLDEPPHYIIPYEHEGNIGELTIFPEVKDWLQVPPWKGSAHSCPSDEDFYGYTHLEWDVKMCVFLPDDENIPDVYVEKKKQDFSQETLDNIEQLVLEYCLDVTAENGKDEYVLSSYYTHS